MPDKINIAVIGAGRLGRLHLRKYKEIGNVGLAGVCDVDGQKADSAACEFLTRAFHNYREIPQTVDAVSVATPTSTHYEVAEYFLKRGVHCLVEKPITLTLKEADALVKIARNNKAILQVGHVERFNSAFAAVKDMIKEPKFIEAHRLSPFPNRSLDVGVTLDLMIHDIDIILGLINSPIKRIDAVGVKVLSEYEDIANARISFKNGCVANLTASRVSEEWMRKIRIFLPQAYISLDYKAAEATLYTKKGGSISKQDLPIEKEEPLKKELESFVHCVAHKCQPLISGKEGRQALAVALKIQKKIRDG
ncbi:MAG: Gfo/Idh/MocA family oxidoreductase [Candidatus Omnitrophica bacterium]|nr:Gfo/Idh/MocA family oxidoreductase [Candidatus Omnitrophota bacterium]